MSLNLICSIDWLFDIARTQPRDLRPSLCIEQAPVRQGGAEEIMSETCKKIDML